MDTLTVTAKGQVTFRKEVLKHLGIGPGEKIRIDKLPNGRLKVQAARPVGRISEVFNCLKKAQQPAVSLEDMQEVIAEGWARQR